MLKKVVRGGPYVGGDYFLQSPAGFFKRYGFLRAVKPELENGPFMRVADLPHAIAEPDACALHAGPYLTITHPDYPEFILLACSTDQPKP